MRSLLYAALLSAFGPLPALAAPGVPTSAAPERAWIFFADHGFVDAAQERAAIDAARTAMTARTRARRAKVHAEVDLLDVPPAAAYVDAVRATGAHTRVLSRWLNAVSVEASSDQLAAI